MEISQSNKSILNFLIPFLTAFLGSKGIFYIFGFESFMYSDSFDVQKLLIELFVFGVLFYIGSLGANYITNKKNPN